MPSTAAKDEKGERSTDPQAADSISNVKVASNPHAFARVNRLELSEVLLLALDEVGELVEERRTGVGERVATPSSVERLAVNTWVSAGFISRTLRHSPSSLDSNIDISCLAGGDIGDLLSCSWVEGFESFPINGVNPFVVDEQLGWYRSLATGEKRELSGHDKARQARRVGSGEGL